MKAIRVLVIEDNALNAMLLAELLAEMGHGVCAIAATEAGAIATAYRHRPDLVIADVRLRDGSGIVAVEAILRGGPVPYIFVTGDPVDVKMRLPEAIVIRKPYSPVSLAESIERALTGAPHCEHHDNVGTVNDTVVPGEVLVVVSRPLS